MLHVYFGSSEKLSRSRALLVHDFLLELEEIPDAYSHIEGATGDEGVFGMEGGTHHVVRVAC